MRLFAFLLAVAGTSSATADESKLDPVKLAPRVLKPAEVGVGRMIPNVPFTDLTGKAGNLSDFRLSKLTVVAFTSTSCPISKKYVPTLARLEKEYGAKGGVAFLFINPVATDTPDAKAFAGRYVRDNDGELTAAFAANATTEVFVLDSTRTVIYCGAVDDQYGLGYSREQPRSRYLAVALDEALAGKVPVTAATEAPGCTLEPDAAKVKPVDLTYHARIERIIQANCIECHRSGGVAPFSLEKYAEVVAHKGIIKNVVDSGTMPPWFAVESTKAKHSLFANDRSLTANDKKDLLTWLGGDLKKGDPADAPLPRKYDSGWLIGKPDAVFQLPKPIGVKAEGTMPYQNVSVETNLDEDKWVRAPELQPTAREVVHHVLVHAIPRGALPLRNPGVGAIRQGGDDEAQGFFAIYVPGNSCLIYPEGFAKKLPKGCTLRFQIHYTPNGKATSDQTKFGMVFAKEPPRHEVKVFGIINRSFEIPPGNDNYKVSANIIVPFDAHILAFAPHMHLRGKAARYELKTTDSQTSTLLDVPHYDFNWQLLYRFATPVHAPRGSNLSFTAWYDNSEGNPANPNPKKAVKWGQQTYDEMHLGYVEYFVDGPGKGPAADEPKTAVKIPPGGVEIPEAFKGIFKRYDLNGDGKLDEKEIDALPPALKERVLDFIRRAMP